MSKYVTIVIRMPDAEADKQKVKIAMNSLQPYQTAMSLEDEMTVLEMIEQHEDFDSNIADEARAKTLALHSQAETVN